MKLTDGQRAQLDRLDRSGTPGRFERGALLALQVQLERGQRDPETETDLEQVRRILGRQS